VSYILDALRKAAEQRGATTSVLFRPAPAQVGASRSLSPWLIVGALVIVNLAVLVWLFRPTSGPELPPRAVSASAPAVSSAPPAASPSAVTSARPAPSTAASSGVPTPPPTQPAASASSAPAASSARATSTAPAVSSALPAASSAPPAIAHAPSSVPTATPVQRPVDVAPPRPADLIPPPHAPAARAPAVHAAPKAPAPATPPSNRVTASRAVPTGPRAIAQERSSAPPTAEATASPRSRSERPPGAIVPMTPAAAPQASAAPSATGDRGKLKLEVVSYSDTPAQRLVFISGRKYVEGDTTEGGYRVEQINEDSVVLSDQGVRFTLR